MDALLCVGVGTGTTGLAPPGLVQTWAVREDDSYSAVSSGKPSPSTSWNRTSLTKPEMVVA